MAKNSVNPYRARLEKMWEWMAQEGISLLMFEDTEGRRDASIRWLTGHPGDALLFLSLASSAGSSKQGPADFANESSSGSSVVHKSLLLPWDIILAKVYARADFILPYNEFDRTPRKAIHGAIEKLKIPSGSKIEIPPSTPYPVFLDYVGELSDFDIICRDKSAASYALDLRAVKEAQEIAILKKAADITNTIIDLLEKNVRSGKIKTEADAAMFIELESRKRGCDGTSFETLAAGPERSFGIHAFPSWTGAPFAGPGLSILDFGLRFGGYCTDVTLTFVREPNAQQQKMVSMVEKAARIAGEMAVNGGETQVIASVVDGFFAKSKKHMPHGLGHGLGLDVHEYPFIRKGTSSLSGFSGGYRNHVSDGWQLEPGMVFTLEPGLYDPVHGGCRLENDFLITETGNEILTKARIIYL